MRSACLVSRRAGIVVLGHEDGKEERAESALFGARQVELAVGFPLADIAAVIELAIHGVNVAVEDQRARMQGARAFGNGRRRRRSARSARPPRPPASPIRRPLAYNRGYSEIFS